MADSELIEVCMAQKTAVVVLNVDGLAAPAVSGLLALLGGDLPISASQDQKGAIARFNEALLQSSGGSVNQWTGFNRQWLSSPKAAEYLGKALELLQKEFDGSYLMLFDDPGMARLLPFWNIVFEHAGILPRYLFVMEEPTDVAAALKAREDIDARSAHLIWLRTALDAECHSRGRLRAFADPVLLGEHPAAVMKKLARTLKLILPRDVQTALASANSFVEKLHSLPQHRYSADRQGDGMLAMADWVKVTQSTFSEWATGVETEEAHYLLDAVREAFDDAAPAFLGIGTASAETVRRLRELEQDRDAAQAEALQSREMERSLRMEAEREGLRVTQVHTGLKDRISYLESALAQRKAEVEDTRDLLDVSRREIGSLKQELASARAAADKETEHLREVAQDRARALEDVQDQLRDRYTEIVKLSRMLASETAAARKFERKSARLGTIAQIFEKGGGRGPLASRFGWMLPWHWHLLRIRRRIERTGIFDGNAYLAANPDVARAGIDPLRHYLAHGADEGRPLGIE